MLIKFYYLVGVLVVMSSSELTSTSSTLPRLTVISWSKSLFQKLYPLFPKKGCIFSSQKWQGRKWCQNSPKKENGGKILPKEWNGRNWCQNSPKEGNGRNWCQNSPQQRKCKKTVPKFSQTKEMEEIDACAEDSQSPASCPSPRSFPKPSRTLPMTKFEMRKRES